MALTLLDDAAQYHACHLSGALQTANNTIFQRVNREWLINLAGGRALLMELAHPLVAAGVAEHSEFALHPLRRLWRTWKVMTQIIFGEAAAQRRAIAAFYGCHAHVHGRLSSATGHYPAGHAYHAHDAELKLWVLATLIDSALVGYENFIAPLTRAEKQQYYEASKQVAQALGIPAQVMPRDHSKFESYLAGTIEQELYVGEDARRIVAALFASRSLRPLVKVMHAFGVGLLPPGLRAQYRFDWDMHDAARLQRSAACLRRVRAFLPVALCVIPQYWVFESRAKRTFCNASC